jgi:hypothetical protein
MRLDRIPNSNLVRTLLKRANRDADLRRILRLDLSQIAAAAQVSASTVARHLRGERVRDDAAARIDLTLGAATA